MREAAFDVASMAKTSTKRVRARGDGAPCRLDHRRGRHGRRRRHADAAAAAVSRDRVRRGALPGARSTRKVDAVRLLLRRRVRGIAGRRRQAAGRSRRARRVRPRAAGRRRADDRRRSSRTSSGTSIHWAVADYLQRAARHLASKTDLAQAYAVGKAAVELALAGNNAVMPAIVRTSDKPYRWKIERGAARQGRQRREEAAARLHHRRRLRHHRQGARAISRR